MSGRSSVWQWFDYERRRRVAFACTATVLAALFGVIHFGAKATESPQATQPRPAAGNRAGAVELSESQLQTINPGPVSARALPLERAAVGSIDFKEDMLAQVSPPYQGRIAKLYARIGDNVK